MSASPITRLPPAAAAKLNALTSQASDAALLARATPAAIKDAEERKANWDNRASTATNERDAAEATREIVAIDAELANLKDAQRAKQARSANLQQTLNSVRYWLDRLPSNVTLAEHRHTMRVSRGDGVEYAVRKVREKIADLQRELQAARHAPLPKPDLKAAARAYVATLVERGRPRMTGTAGKFETRFGRLDATTPGTTPLDVAAFVAWFDPDKFTRRLEAEIDALSIESAMTAPQRTARVSELESELLKAEREEEALIEQGGHDVLRRPQADPRAILGVRIAQAQAAAA